MMFKRELELLIVGLLVMVIGFFNLIFFVNKYIDKSVVERKQMISELIEIEHITLEKTTDFKSIEDQIQECIYYQIYLENLILDEDSDNYETNKKNITKELENIEQIKGIYYSQYRDLTYKKIKEREEKKTTEATIKNTTTSSIQSTTKTQTTTTKQQSQITTKPVTTTQPTTTPPQTTVTSSKYSTAATIWNYLKKQGYNNYVCAGILGNIMTEVGGHTLDIQPGLYGEGDNYYGICQWSIKYYPEIDGAGLSTQLNFLANTIKYEFNTYGYKYQSGFDYNDFINLKDAKAAALAFAQVYERCRSSSYTKRQNNAIIAYDYFAN